MKLAKMLGLAAIMALAAMAFVGAGTASATSMCKNQACTEKYPAKTLFESTSPSAKLVGTITVTCASKANVETLAETGTPLSGQVPVGGLSFTGCSGCESATPEELPYPGHAEASGLGDGNGTITVEKVKVTLKGCTFLKITCVATATSVTLDFVHGEGGSAEKDAKVIASEEPIKLSGGSCGESGKWTGTYTVVKAGATANPPVFMG